MKFRYDTSGRWYKGNTHIHSTASDGGRTADELAAMYASAGYHFLFRTDHWTASDTAAEPGNDPLLWLDGIELDGADHTGAYFHVVALGRVKGLCREDGLEAGLRRAQQQGALLILAHPHWCANSFEDARRWPFDGVEIYNHVCHWMNGKSSGLAHWDAMLTRKPGTLALAADDAHLRPEHPGWNGGWIVANAPECTRDAILDALRRGNFYASCGPQLFSLALNDDQLEIEMSPVRFVRLVGPGPRGVRWGSFGGPLIERLRVAVPRDWSYVYLEIEDAAGRRAWTQSLFSPKQPVAETET